MNDIYEFMRSVVREALENGHEIHMEKKLSSEKSNTLGSFNTSSFTDEGLSIHIYAKDYRSVFDSEE